MFCYAEDDQELSAFTASIGSTHSYDTGDVIIFDQIVTNVGNHYHPNTSTYVCPLKGLYVFSVSVLNTVSNHMKVNLMRENTHLGSGYSHVGDHNQGALSVVAECERGERVWVRCYGSSYAYVHQSYDWNIFSGFALHYY